MDWPVIQRLRSSVFNSRPAAAGLRAFTAEKPNGQNDGITMSIVSTLLGNLARTPSRMLREMDRLKTRYQSRNYANRRRLRPGSAGTNTSADHITVTPLRQEIWVC